MGSGRAKINVQLEQLNQVYAENPNLSRILGLYRLLLLSREKLEEDPSKGTSISLSEGFIKALQEEAKKAGKPITYLLKGNIFRPEAILETIELIVDALTKYDIDGRLQILPTLLREDQASLIKLLDAALRNNEEVLEELSSRFNQDPKVLSLIINTSLQPLLEELVRKVDQRFLEEYFHTSCPICGRKPVVAKLKEKKKYLVCPLCGAEYRVEQLLCVNCGNRNPETLCFLFNEGKPGIRIDVCTECKHYIKVIDQDRIRMHLPNGLEDILTRELDEIAKAKGFNPVSR